MKWDDAKCCVCGHPWRDGDGRDIHPADCPRQAYRPGVVVPDPDISGYEMAVSLSEWSSPSEMSFLVWVKDLVCLAGFVLATAAGLIGSFWLLSLAVVLFVAALVMVVAIWASDRRT